MSDQVTIKVADLLGRNICISAEDGQRVYGKIEQQVKAGRKVTVSFDNVTLLISLFLNVAIGQLYGTFDEKVIRSLLRIEGLPTDDMELLDLVVSNAKKYYANRASCNKA